MAHTPQQIIEITEEITASLEAMSDPFRKEKAESYAPTSMVMLGVSNPDVQQVVGEVHSTHREQSPAFFIDLAKALVGTGIFECQHLAWSLFDKRRRLLEALQHSDLDYLRGVQDNWASVDAFGTVIYGWMWRNGKIPDQEVYALQESGDVWKRRLALVGCVALNTRSRGGTGDAGRTLRVCKEAVSDHEDMIVKALSWALRSLVYWDSEAVREFLELHNGQLARRVKREVLHKLDHGTKN